SIQSPTNVPAIAGPATTAKPNDTQASTFVPLACVLLMMVPAAMLCLLSEQDPRRCGEDRAEQVLDHPRAGAGGDEQLPDGEDRDGPAGPLGDPFGVAAGDGDGQADRVQPGHT